MEKESKSTKQNLSTSAKKEKLGNYSKNKYKETEMK